MPDKDWYKSTTVWGAVIMIIAFVLGLLGFSITTEEQQKLISLIVSIATPVGELVGLILVISGRKKVGKELVMAKGLIAKSVAEADMQFPKNWIWIFEKVFGKEANAVVSSGMFLISSEGRTMLRAMRDAAKSEKGKILLEQIEKIV